MATPLADLPYDIQILIMRRIPCSFDREPMTLVCRAWRDMVRNHNGQPPPLPWLLLPTAPNQVDGAAKPHRIACVLSGCSVHHHLTIKPPGARCFGSHDGAWLLLHYRDRENRGNRAVNVRTGLAERLPERLLRRAGSLLCNMVVLAAALSSPPDDAGCVAAAIVVAAPYGYASLRDAPPQRLHRCVALWRKGWQRARERVPPEANDAALEVDDVAFHGGAFHMVTQGNHIRVCTPEFELEDADDLSVNWETRRFQPGGVICDDQYVHSRYLVVSRGELLLVLRFTPEANQPTSKFKVFEAIAADTDNTDYPVARYPWAWRELDTLDGRMLFVGQGCSRSYETNADQYPGFKDGVYFMDDGESNNAPVILGNRMQYPCSDNGRWSEGHVQRCFPVPQPSYYTSPAWIFH